MCRGSLVLGEQNSAGTKTTRKARSVKKAHQIKKSSSVPSFGQPGGSIGDTEFRSERETTKKTKVVALNWKRVGECIERPKRQNIGGDKGRGGQIKRAKVIKKRKVLLEGEGNLREGLRGRYRFADNKGSIRL